MRRVLVLRAFALLFLAALPAAAQHAVRVSVDSFGAQADGPSLGAALSADGRYVAFVSEASNLVQNDTNGVADVFVRDTLLQTTRRVSVSSAGTQGDATSGTAGGASDTTPMLGCSADGRQVAFYSQATNFAPGITPGFGQIYVRDLATGITQLVSQGSAGTPADSGAFGAWISADGRSVLFVSRSGNLAPGGSSFLSDIFVRDLPTQTTRRLVASSHPTPYVQVGEPAPSADGRYVAYHVYRIVGPQAFHDIELLDRDADADGLFDEPGATATIPITAATPASGYLLPAIAGGGRFVTYHDAAFQLVRHDRDADVDGILDEPGATATLSLGVLQPGPASFYYLPSPLSDDGRLVALLSTNPAPLATLHEQLFVHDTQTGERRVASYNGSSGAPALGPPLSGYAAISGDGLVVAYDTLASNLVPGDTNGVADVFVFAVDDPYCFGTTSYCIGAPNSVGLGALIGWSGSLSIAEDDFVLGVVGCPPGTSGLFFYGAGATDVPFGNGHLCVEGALFRLGAQSVDGAGHAFRPLLLHQPPLNAGPGAITPASAWNFQFWYRNPAGGGAGFNTSDALHAVFCP
jgi:hypothetical protein